MSVISIRGVPTFHDDAGGGPEVGAGDLADILLTAPLPLSARTELAACLDVEQPLCPADLQRAASTSSTSTPIASLGCTKLTRDPAVPRFASSYSRRTPRPRRSAVTASMSSTP
jgi:hypothetical protein